MADAFRSVPYIWHPTLCETYKLPADFHYPLVQGFLQDERYARWAEGYRPWQLHCTGAPGCGKTTFASVVGQELKKLHHGTQVRVASIFLRERVTHEQTTFVEDFLACFYSQVSPNQEGCDLAAGEQSLPPDYKMACQDGKAYATRIDTLRRELHVLLRSNEHNFLIVDGFDQLDAASRRLLEHELRDSHLHNISLMVTRRVPCFEKPRPWRVRCDGCDKDPVFLYWSCSDCPPYAQDFCYECKEKGFLCTEGHDVSVLNEPYNCIEFDISTPFRQKISYDKDFRDPMLEYVTKELEIDIVFSNNEGLELIHKAAVTIVERAHGNITMAKLRIEEMLATDLGETLEGVGDHLPRSILAFFDDEISRIESQSSALRELALLAIVAVAECESYQGVLVEELEAITRNARKESPHLGLHSIRSLEDFLDVANGLIELAPYIDLLEVWFWHADFAIYVKENYNKTLSLLKARLHRPGLEAGEDPKYYSKRLLLTEFDRKPEKQDNTVHKPQQSDAMSLCSFCEESILRGNSKNSIHHRSATSLGTSATQNCLFCSDLYDDILQSFTGDSAAHEIHAVQDWPLYSWVVRFPAKVRNSKTALAINFRPVIGNGSESTAARKSRTYRILAEADIGTIPLPEDLGTSTDPTRTGGVQLKKWMRTCRDTHPICYRRKEGEFVPTRLVDLQCKDQSIVRIVDTKKEGIESRYCTLSHSWGPPTFLQLRVVNEAQLMGSGVAISKLSKNFQQAISVARFMGERYIWIDSLCIKQGAGGDFAKEGQLMPRVYSHSFCNIAIADSSDGEGGLFRDRKPCDILPARYMSDGTGKLDSGTWRIVREDLWKAVLLGTKIYTRGWVYQERMLSSRIVYFAASQIFWDCGAISACEALPDGLPHALDDIASTDRHWRGRIQATSDSSGVQPPVGANNGSMSQFWKSALLNYTSCDLTNEDDKTRGIWSIAKIIRDDLAREDEGEDYAAGFWKRAFEEQLPWRMKQSGVLESRIPELQVKYPSWSWASVKGAVLAHDRLTACRFYTVTGLDGLSPISLPIAPYSSRDIEPGLSDGSMPMSGYIGRGRVVLTKPGHFEMTVLARSGEDASASAGIFEAFPDECVPSTDTQNHAIFEFIILAASIFHPGGFALPGVDEDAADEDVTVSGTALLLTPHTAYKAQQYARYKSLLRQVVGKSPEEREPDPPFGMGKSLVQKTAVMRDVVKMLKDRERRTYGSIGSVSWYRRVGAVKFHGLSLGAWRKLRKDGRVHIVLH